MVNLTEVLSLLLVGAFWGCTNPLLRKGSSEQRQETSDEDKSFSLKESLYKFRQWRVWLPYLLNQCGSLVYYYLLSSSSLSLAVPVCNALALVFSLITSHVLGERVDQPVRAMLGSALVIVGVAICLSSQGTTSLEERREEL